MAAGILFLAFVPLATAAPAPADARPSVETIKVTRATLSHKLTAPGSLEAFEQADLYAKASGYLSEVRVDIGDHVKAGQLLAMIDVPELADDLIEASAVLAARQKSIEAADAMVRQSQALLETARQNLNHYDAEYALQQITLKRQQELYAGKAATEQQIDDIRGKAEVARADVSVAKSKIAGAEADLLASQANRAVAAAQAEVAAAQVAKAKTLLGYTRITAPFDGVITRRLVNQGDLVQAALTSRTTPLFTVQRIDTIRVFCEIPENDVAWLTVGDTATIKPYGLPGKPLDGKVTRTAKSLNPQTRTMRIEIDLPNPREQLLPGMYAQIALDCGRRENVLTLPASAVSSDAKGDFVLGIENETVTRLPVKIGFNDGASAELVEGASEGAQIVTSAKTAPAPGTTVRAITKL